MPTSSTPTTLSIAQLREQIRGRVIDPDDDEYDKARTVFLGGVDDRPAVIVRVADATDVATVIALARGTGLDLAVRGGGHSSAGHSSSEGGIVLDLGGMKALDIDVEGRTAWAETGLTAAEYSEAVGAHGLVDRVRRHGLGRDRRDHARRWRRLPRPEVRPHDRRPACRRRRDRGRRAPSRRRGEPSGPVLGDPWRWR